MEISRRHVGYTSNTPRAVEAFRLQKAGAINVEVWTLGATLVAVEVPDKHGNMCNVCLRLPDLAAYENPATNALIGSVIGRFARCIAFGKFVLCGQEYAVECNIGEHHFHGGKIGFDRFVWDADIENNADTIRLRLRLTRPDGDQGYPGSIEAETTYEIDQAGRLVIAHSATVSAPTIVSLTCHAFWNLAGGGHINEHALQVNADRLIACGPDFIPLPGPPVCVTRQGLDFRSARKLGENVLDNCFVLENSAWAVELSDLASGRKLLMQTDQPGLAVYTGDHLPNRRNGVCLQSTALPDAPNRADFPSARIDPGQIYRHRTVYTFSSA
ncbi:galactose mutarotase [Neorhizobium sp. BETTINA12A]|uniref:aldose epimerase family protein n=1 Tax=Neorhizobium sp. BETTINA12A TaxID=2908924 RepID=UPI001FF1C575|nr:aldose epimerase family protein [Neorhizobium sp. BETTINA12A]MCJ9750389.1 galactose mutarotase [Neorhizobium sp. BETTINA12A]